MKEYEIIKALDSIISKHLIRLIGTDKGVNGLPLTLLTITALVLLGEKDQGSPDLTSPPERYTREELMDELEQIGIFLHGPLKEEFEMLFKYGYVHQGKDGTIIPLEPAVKTARLVDVLFKGMPGISLVAYLIQLFCEVIAGQKTLELALESIDHTLNTIGVVPNRKPSSRPAAKDEGGPSMQRLEAETE